MHIELRRISIGGLFAAAGVALLVASVFVMFDGPQDIGLDGKLWKAFALLGVVLCIRAIWVWWEIDRQLALALVIALAVPAMGVAALQNAVEQPEQTWLHRTAEEIESLRMRAYIFFAVGGIAALWAGERIRRLVKRST